MNRIALPLVVLFLIAFSPSASGEKVSMSPEQLRKTATHVITGTVPTFFSAAKL